MKVIQGGKKVVRKMKKEMEKERGKIRKDKKIVQKIYRWSKWLLLKPQLRTRMYTNIAVTIIEKKKKN